MKVLEKSNEFRRGGAMFGDSFREVLAVAIKHLGERDVVVGGLIPPNILTRSFEREISFKYSHHARRNSAREIEDRGSANDHLIALNDTHRDAGQRCSGRTSLSDFELTCAADFEPGGVLE